MDDDNWSGLALLFVAISNVMLWVTVMYHISRKGHNGRN